MSPKLQSQIAKSDEEALAAFVSKKAEIDEMLTRLQALSDEHFNYSPDEIDWGHVGTLGYYAELLKRVSDTQAVILSAASQRDDGAVLPLPETLKIKGGAVDKVLGSLKTKGLIDRMGTPRGDDPPRLRITRARLEAIGVEPDDGETGPAEADTAAASAEAAPAGGTPAPTTAGDDEAAPGKRRAKTKAAKRGEAAPAEKPTPRAGTKQAQMIEMLKRPEGATVEQIAEATGWQHHTIRGAIFGALKKKLGLSVKATRTREVGPNKAGAKGSATTYRIVE